MLLLGRNILVGKPNQPLTEVVLDLMTSEVFNSLVSGSTVGANDIRICDRNAITGENCNPAKTALRYYDLITVNST